METSFLALLLGWVCGVVSETLKAWCSKRLLRRLEGQEPDAPDNATPEPDPLPPDPPTIPPPERSSPLIDRLYETIARYRRGDSQ